MKENKGPMWESLEGDFKKGIYDIIILISKLKEEMKKGKLL